MDDRGQSYDFSEDYVLTGETYYRICKVSIS